MKRFILGTNSRLWFELHCSSRSTSTGSAPCNLAVHPKRLNTIQLAQVMRIRAQRRSGWLCARLELALVAVLLSLWAVRTHATDASCQKKAESLGWAISCGCLKHDLSIVQDNLSLLLPNCQSEDSETLAKDVANGLKKAADHLGEYNFLCMLLCNSKSCL